MRYIYRGTGKLLINIDDNRLAASTNYFYLVYRYLKKKVKPRGANSVVFFVLWLSTGLRLSSCNNSSSWFFIKASIFNISAAILLGNSILIQDLSPKLIIYDPLNPVNNVGRATYRIVSLKVNIYPF